MKYQTYTFYSPNFEEFSNILNNHINEINKSSGIIDNIQFSTSPYSNSGNINLNLNGNRTGTILNNITNTASYNDNENTNINGTFNKNNTSTIFSCLILWHQA